MSPHRRATLFAAARFLAVLIVLAAPWPGLGRAYVAAYGSVAAVIAKPILASSGVELAFAPSADDDAKHEWFAMLSVLDAQTHARQHKMATDLRRSGYLQMALYLAAAAAYPLRNRVRFLVVVTAGLALFAAFGWLPILMYLAKKQIITLGSGSLSLLSLVYRSLVTPPGMAFAVPGLLWLAARTFLEKPSPPPAQRKTLDPSVSLV
jgi:hypothetical protein